ncbi:PAS domain S-box protein [Halorussus litoreus]|uniref:PAS domain S-box protein n=1 Tax=Halorussus litoreus TaxID=1710536 RepID=UPI000E24105D|nr:PAS domain S-box protein [Halorussus litoreus]
MSERAAPSEAAFWGDASDEDALDRYRALVNVIDDGIYQLDAEGRFVAVNEVIVETTGYEREELLGEHVSVLLDPDDLATLGDEIRRRLSESSEPKGTFEIAVQTADGGRVPCELRMNLLVEEGELQGTVGVVRDVSEQRRTEHALDEFRAREQELREYETIVEAVDDGVYVVDEDGRFALVNEAYAELTGYSRDRLLGEHVSLVADEEVRRRANELEAKMREGDADDAVIEAELETASGERVPTEATFAMLPGPDSDRRVGVVRDISERRERERALQERERQLSTLMDNVPGMVYRCRNERGWPMEFVSDACREVTGYDPAAVERGDVSWGDDVMVEDDRSTLWDDVQTAVENRETFSTTYRIETADGERRWVRDYGRGVFDGDGAVVAIEGIISDVTERKRLEAELDEVFGRVTDAFYALDTQWQFTHANDRAEDLIDYRGEGLVGRDFWEVFEWATDSKLGEEYRTAMETQESTSFEFYYPEPLESWYEVHAYPSETGLSVYFRDITERRERERELEESERRYRTLVEHFPNGAVALVDDNLRYQTVGGSPLDVANATPEEVEGSPVREVLPPELADELAPRYEAALDGEASEFEADYTDQVFRFHVVPVRDDDGEVFAALGMSQDVTERTAYERKLAASERRYRTLAENFPNGTVTLFDHDLRYTLAAGQGFDRIPVEPSDLEGTFFRDAWDEDTADALEPAFQAALDGEERSVELEYAGREWILHGVPITDERGDVFAGMTMAQDVTEQKEREQDLRDARTQLEAAAEAGAVGTWEWNVPEDEFVTDASFARTFGVDPDAAREGVSLDRFVSAIHEDDRERAERQIWEAVETCGEYESEYRVRNAEGELRWVVARGHAECDEQGDPVTFPGALADITERKRAERELEDHRKQLETLFEVLPVGVAVANGDGTFVEANETAKELWGGDVFEAADLTEYDEYEGWWADTGEPIAADEWTMARVLRGEEIEEPDIYEIADADGKRRVVMAHGMPVREANGKVIRGVVTVTDITERREYQRQLEETVEKLEASNERLESFASMLAHELRNPVTIGQIYGQQLPDEAAPEAVDYVTEAFDRIEDMIDVMLVLTRGGDAVSECNRLSIPAVAREAWDGIDASEATLAVETDATLRADETYLRHLFRNLFENSIEHGTASSTRSTGEAAEQSDDAAQQGHDETDEQRSDGLTIRVGELEDGFYVADDGTGIPAEDRDEVFEVGVTSAADEGGTGLGLAFVAKLAEVYGWTCSVTESESGGARFEFRNVGLESME